SFGLVATSTDRNGNAAAYVYDSLNLYPAATSNALSQSTEYTCALTAVNASSSAVCKTHPSFKYKVGRLLASACKDQASRAPSNERIELRPPEKRVLPIDARARLVTRTAFAILVVLLAFWVARDLLSALTWAAVIAITTWPIYIRFASLISDGRSPVLVPMLF